MRGRTLNHSFIILDEAQNTTPEQMKMFLTRIGFGTKAVITGDVTQIDLARGQKSGLIEAERILAGVRGIAFTRFTSADVVRHPLVQKIVNAYERDAAAKKPRRGAARDAGRRPAMTPRAALALARPVRGRRDGAAGAAHAAPLGAGGAASATRAVTRALRRRRARAARSTAIFRGKDYATNVLTFVYDDGRRRSPATSCCARRWCAREARAAGQDADAPTTRTWSSTACCTCRATTTTRRATPRAMEARETRDPRRARGIRDPYAAPLRRPALTMDDQRRQAAARSRRCSSGCRRS